MTKILMSSPCNKCFGSYAVMADDGRLNCAQCSISRGVMGTPIRNFITGCIKQFGPLDAPVLIYPKPPIDIAVNDCAKDPDGTATESTKNDKRPNNQ
jgi:hypothetical protein